MSINLNNAEFILSAVRPENFISDGRPAVVFAGKSNVGKSSVINKLCNRKNFARVGSEPGKTVHVNYFLLDRSLYFVDLPGYGYASVSKSERSRWAKLMETFFSRPDRISLGVLIVDSRHKPTEDDKLMADWFKLSDRPFVVAANKVDKVKSSELSDKFMLICETLGLTEDTPVIPFSALKGTGRDTLLAKIVKLV